MSNIIIREKAKEHYNMVSDPWRYIFGDDFHVGYFEDNVQDLDSATKFLIDKLASLASFDKNSKVLDVGCGIGEPAFYLNKKFGSKITGITISERGEEIASQTCMEKGLSKDISFKVADILHSDFENNSFDIIWIMEVSHLIKDKKRLFAETNRILKNKGSIVLCDFMLNVNQSILEGFKFYKDVFKFLKNEQILINTFGKAHLLTLNKYIKLMKDAGFTNFEDVDVRLNVLPTIGMWRKNIEKNFSIISQSLNKKQIEEFLAACDILEDIFRANILTYRFIKAVKE